MSGKLNTSPNQYWPNLRHKDSYQFGDHESWLLKIPFGDHKKNPDLKWFDSNRWSWIQQIFKGSTCVHESSRIFGTITWNESLKIKIGESRILANPDWRTRESRFAKPDPLRFDLWIGFRKIKIPKSSTRIDLYGFVCKSCNLTKITSPQII